jgi:Cu-processing system permease protein
MARAISRVQFILGKYLGLVLTILVNVLVMLAVFLVTLWMTKASINGALLQAVQLIIVELLLVTALALFFSTFTSSTLSAILTIALFVISHLTVDLKDLSEKSKSGMIKAIMSGLYYVCPNLEALNIKGQAAMGTGVTLVYQATATTYGLLYTGVLLTGACIIFQYRDFR